MVCWFKDLCGLLSVNAPHVFVQTGTYKGDGVQRVINDFKEVHSIDLNANFVMGALERFKLDDHVFIHHGDSSEVLESLCESIKEPAMFYLDAHFSGGDTAFGRPEDKGCPLLRELTVIGKRPYNDIVVVDDMRLMDKCNMENIKKAWNSTGNKGTDSKMHMCADFDCLVIYQLRLNP